MIKKKRHFLIIFLIALVLLILVGICVGFLERNSKANATEYWPGNLKDADEYVWIDKKQDIFLVNNDKLGMIGLWKYKGSEIPVFFSYSRLCGEFRKYRDDLLLTEDGTQFSVNNMGDFLQEKINTYAPVFKENGFSVKISERGETTFFAGERKLLFVKNKKSEILPNDIGFETESWDTVLANIRYYYRVDWGNGLWGDFYFDDYDGTSSEKCLKFRELLDEGKEEEAMKLVDAFGLQGQ